MEELYTDKIMSLCIDDMEIAPDFFDYFEAAAALLDKDKYCLMGELKTCKWWTSFYMSYTSEIDFYHVFWFWTMIGPLWLFPHGTTMDKSSLCMILVSFFHPPFSIIHWLDILFANV